MAEGKPKILIAEDDHFLSFLLRGQLEKAGFFVWQAADGADVMNLLKSEKPDLIVLDLIMPKVSGFEIMERLSIDPQLASIPIIILSNLGQTEDMEKAKRMGAKEYFIKARTKIEEVIETINRITNNHDQPRSEGEN